MKVNLIGWGYLKGENGDILYCDFDGYGNVLNESTGEIYEITKRDKNDNPIEIKPLSTINSQVIKKSLECCIGYQECSKCPLNTGSSDTDECKSKCMSNALNYILTLEKRIKLFVQNKQ